MKFKQTLLNLCVALVIASQISEIKAQVTIGNSEAPEKGALLQLKNIDDVSAGGANATKGLALPRVMLYGLSGDLATSLGNTNAGSMNANEHVGLTIYNLATCLDGERTKPGIRIWMGTKWESLQSGEDGTWTGETVTGRSGYKYKVASFGSAGKWIIEDMKETQYDTDEIQNTITPSSADLTAESYKTDGRYYYFPSDQQPTGNIASDRVWFDKYKERGIGLYYTWAAATNGKHSDYYHGLGVVNPRNSTKRSYVQGICPNGWVVPSDYDFTVLEKEIIANYTNYSSSTEAPEPWTDDWLTSTASYLGTGLIVAHAPRGTHSNHMKTPCVTPGYTNPSGGSSLAVGYNAMLNGYIDPAGTLIAPGANLHNWSSSLGYNLSAYIAYYRYFNNNAGSIYNDKGVGRYPNFVSYRFNVRCKESPDTRIRTVRGRSGSAYRYMNFGPAGDWMIDNLNETQYDDGTNDVVTEGRTTSGEFNTRKYYYPNNVAITGVVSTDRKWYNENSNENIGLLYSWTAATKGVKSDDASANFAHNTTKSNVQGICPSGWVIPSDYEWSLLEKEIATNAPNYSTSAAFSWNDTYMDNGDGVTPPSTDRGTHAAAMMSPRILPNATSQTNPGGTSSEAGFNALLVGYIYNNTVTQNGGNTHIWSSSGLAGAPDRSFYRYFNNSSTRVGRFPNSTSYMFSVRCKRQGT